MKKAQDRMKFMLQYEGLRIMTEIQSSNTSNHSMSQSEFNPDFEKTKPDGAPLTLIDLIYDKRYAERE